MYALLFNVLTSDTVTENLLFGFITSIIGGLGAYVLIIEKRHSKEKKEIIERQEKERMETQERQEKERMETLERHFKERKELIEIQKEQFDQISELSQENNKISREHITLLSGIKTLLENQIRNDRR